MALRLASISRCFFASAAAFSRALRSTSRSLAATLALASRSFLAFAAASALAFAAAALAFSAALAFASRSFKSFAAAAALALRAAIFLAALARWAALTVATFFTGLDGPFFASTLFGAGFLATFFTVRFRLFGAPGRFGE